MDSQTKNPSLEGLGFFATQGLTPTIATAKQFAK